MIRRLILSVCLAFVAGSAGAEAVTTLCKLKVSREQSWVPTQVVFRREKGSDTLLVNDPIILYFVKKPLVGHVTAETKSSVSYAWAIERVSNRQNQSTKMRYRATMEKGTGKIKIQAFPAGFGASFLAFGTCKSK